MNRRAFSVFCSGIFIPSRGKAQAQEGEAPSTQTKGFFNGHGWKISDRYSKVTLIHGLHDGIAFALDTAELFEGKTDSKNGHSFVRDSFSLQKFSYGDIVDEIDTLYTDPLNLAIPVTELFFQAARLFKGASPDEVKTAIVGLRKDYA